MHFEDLVKLGVLVLVIAFPALACASTEPKSGFDLECDEGGGRGPSYRLADPEQG